ncbi:MAG: hypothetical protein ACLSTO_01555 [Bilophila wadsworthia]
MGGNIKRAYGLAEHDTALLIFRPRTGVVIVIPDAMICRHGQKAGTPEARALWGAG